MDGGGRTHYESALAALDRRIEREILRLRARHELSLDEFRGLYVSDEQVDALVAARVPDFEMPPPEPALAIADSLGPRWSRLAAAFALTPLEQDLLLLAFATELDLKYETLYAYLNNDVARKWPTLELARRLVGGADAAECARALAPAGKLRSERLIEPIEPPAARPSRLNEGFALAPPVAGFLLGIGPPAATAPCEGDAAHDDAVIAAEPLAKLRGLAAIFRTPRHVPAVLVLLGERGCGRRTAVHALSRELGLALRDLDFAQARRSGLAPAAALEPMLVELRLMPALLCVRGLEALCDREGHLQAEAQALLDVPALDATPIVLLAQPGSPWREVLGRRRALQLELAPPDYAQRHALWTRALGAAGIELPQEHCAELASRFRLNHSGIHAAIATALDWSAAGGRGNMPGADLLAACARAQSEERLGTLASKVAPQHGWNDLVLPATALTRLRELCAAIRMRHVVYAHWGFAERIARGTGVKALFAGPSGTGKTMAASVIARELGLDLYKVDLSGLVSKYIGETEKNLDRVFAAARNGNAILFFDEADAIFGRRSEVKDAHDRYANIEVAYLLQKLEDHDGVVVLASNLKRNIDEAFARRLHYVVDFPTPDAPQREALWRGMFPARAPRADDIDFPFLARQFELAGGDIRNVVLDAAFLAAQYGGAIGMREIVQALARQMAKQGKAPTLADFQLYHPWLRADAAHRPP
ncbi:MAG TPA: ATP-binding protein [Usitatibacter sp.]|nr:ATP-binding protein [Usitatibacter sp.]